MSRRQSERASRFRAEIELDVLSAAAKFCDNNPHASVATAVRLWWTSRLRGRRFGQLVHQAAAITQERISLGTVERGEAGRREAMPYFFAVLHDLVNQHRAARRTTLNPIDGSGDE
jgi:hypothetical protein